MRGNPAGLALLAALVCGCAGFNEAARDRLGWTFAGRTPSLRLRCETPSPLPAPEPTAATTPARLIVRGGPNPERPAVVGELFKWGGGSFAKPQEGKILIVLEHPANDVLAADVTRILLRNGFTVADDGQGSPPVLEAAVAGLDVKGTPAGLTELKGTIRARAAFQATLTRGATVVWRDYFEGDDKTRVSYFLTSDSERSLGRAYCRALEWFEKAVREPKLRDAVTR